MGGDIWSDVIGQNTEFFELNCGDMGELDYGDSLNNNKCGDKSYEDIIKIVGEQNAWYTSVGRYLHQIILVLNRMNCNPNLRSDDGQVCLG